MLVIDVEELNGPTVSALRRAIAEVKQRWAVIGWVTIIYYLELLRVSEGTFSHWSRLHLQSLAPTNPQCVIYKEGMCPSSGGINRLMMSIRCRYIIFFIFLFRHGENTQFRTQRPGH
jgi:hypothetical protein